MPATKKHKKIQSVKRVKSGAHYFIHRSLRLYLANKKLMFGVVGVAIGVNLLIRMLIGGDLASFYQSVWFVFVSASLIWTIRHTATRGKSSAPSISQVYWTGSASALKLVVIFSLLALAAAPFSFGAFIFSTISFLSVDSLMADVIAAAIWLLLGTFTLVLFSRLMIAMIVATLPDIGPMRAVGISWRLSRRQTMALSGRMAIGFAYALVLVGGVSIGLSLLGLSSDWVQISTEVITFGLVLPIFYAVIFLLYKEIS